MGFHTSLSTNGSDPLMAGLKAKPRKVSRRCGKCPQFDICSGNTRVRAQQLTGDPWSEDPGGYLSDEEIGLPPGQQSAAAPTHPTRVIRLEVAHV